MKRNWMIDARTARGWTSQEASVALGISQQLYDMLEDGSTITHPHIADDIVKLYGADVAAYNGLVHESHALKKLHKRSKSTRSIYEAEQD